MRVLLTGATGFVGAAVLARLNASGSEVIAVARPGSNAPRGRAFQWLEVDFGRATTDTWSTQLNGIDAVVNCAGVFADSARESTQAVHVDGAVALFRACVAAGVRRVVHLSAIGVEDRLTPFARTKLEAERALRTLDLDAIILRPSIILGEAAYGGGALMRGLAALPVLPSDQSAGPLCVVQLEDVVETIVRFIQPGAPAKLVLDLVGPEQQSLVGLVATLRAWLGWKPARVWTTPHWLMGLAYGCGDVASWLGWRTPIRSAARRELQRGASGDSRAWMEAAGIRPRTLADALAQRPVSLQERRYAALYFIKPLVLIVTALFWMGTGIVSISFGFEVGVAYLREGGMGDMSGPSVVAGGLFDLLIGLGVLFRPTTRLALWLGIAVSVFYAVAGTLVLPRLWLDPIGPMLKIWPLIVLNAVGLALARDR